MTLDNLLAIHKLVRQAPDKAGIVLDALRKQRNASDYEGDPVSGKALDSCLQEAGKLRAMLQQWLESEYPEIVD